MGNFVPFSYAEVVTVFRKHLSSMMIDLELPSGEWHKEDSRLDVFVNMTDGCDQGQNRDALNVKFSRTSGHDKENPGPIVCGRVSGDRNREHTGDMFNSSSVKCLDPCNGMEFESKEEAFMFYKEYAKSVGFAAIIKASRRSRISGKFIDAKFVCTRYGSKPEASSTDLPQPVSNVDGTTSIAVKRKRGRTGHSWLKTDCKACMHIKRRQQDGRWVVQSFVKEHNHENFPDQAYHFPTDRASDLCNNAGSLHGISARTKEVAVSMSKQSGGRKKNESQKAGVTNQTRHLALDDGDAELMFDHFMCMQDDNPNFFYAIDLNEEQRLKNVFWIDAKGKLDFSYFGDVVFFDTMYIKNEYKLPFAPFVGVNHHFQFILLGSALIADQMKSTYAWVMQAWLRAMNGHAPRVILTDDDRNLKEAIAEVFPNSHHCYCLWHVLAKIPEKLCYVLRQRDNFMNKFNKCIFESRTSEKFEKRWWKIVDSFNLRNDEWFQSLYEDRHKWIPTFMSDKFLAGMSTTQQPESIHSFLDKYVQRRTSLKEFLEQYKAILREKFEEEAKADFETCYKQPGLKSPSPFGKQMATLYTHAIFKKFQVEVLGVVACHPRKESEDGESKVFKVQDFEDNHDFLVVWNERTSYFSCSCRLFEFSGFLCRHVLIVMQMSGLHSIPPQYILKRWTKDAKSRQRTSEKLNRFQSSVQRYNDLCQRAIRLGGEGSLSQESYCIAFNALEEALRKCEGVNKSIWSAVETPSPSSNTPHDSEEANQANGAVNTDKKNSISNKRQVYTEPEFITIGMHNSWQQMEQLHSRASTFDGYFGPQIVHGMVHLNSVASNRDDYYGNQHGMQELGQLNSIASNLTQQRVQGMGQLHFRPPNITSCFEIQDNIPEMDQSNVGPSHLHGMTSKHLHPKHLSS
ncbi:hypothetical protein K2173_000540 [Erythroxylum novogranatense]|uniref:Protein FAR1-RELATED SEQUENCE n=1 Tax=Erythroxylum novogranatense TaxID=1862640 RepID=A0AAV8SY16_9ROSI|nr:hypothetical protein K2173_000540 [Erythroxylum novogranatense]